jgi:hypothetical protein
MKPRLFAFNVTFMIPVWPYQTLGLWLFFFLWCTIGPCTVLSTILRLSLSSYFFFSTSHALAYIVLYCYLFSLLGTIPFVYVVHDHFAFMRMAYHNASVARFAALISMPKLHKHWPGVHHVADTRETIQEATRLEFGSKPLGYRGDAYATSVTRKRHVCAP